MTTAPSWVNYLAKREDIEIRVPRCKGMDHDKRVSRPHRGRSSTTSSSSSSSEYAPKPQHRSDYLRQSSQQSVHRLLTQSLSSSISSEATRTRSGQAEAICSCPAHRKNRKTVVAVILPVLCGIILIVAFTVNSFISTPKESNNSVQEFHMILAKFSLTIVNRQYSEEMALSSSKAFREVAEPVCQQVSRSFLSSHLRKQYYGCSVNNLRNGSVISSMAILLGQMTSIQAKEILLVLMNNSENIITDGTKYIRLGDFIIYLHKLNVSFQRVKVSEQPEPLQPTDKPRPEINTSTTPMFPADNNQDLELAASATPGFIGGTAVVGCSMANRGEWEYMQVQHQSSGGTNRSLGTLINNGTTYGSDSGPGDYRAFGEVSESNVSLRIVLNARCDDEGIYRCVAHGPGPARYEATTTLRVFAVQQTPELTLPGEVIENRTLSSPITCQARGDRASGQIYWSIGRGDSDEPVEGARAVERKEVAAQNCSGLVTSYLFLEPSMDINGSTISCRVVSSSGSVVRSAAASAVLLVLQGDICGAQSFDVIPHPHTCKMYLVCLETGFRVYRCPDDECFNKTTKRCDSPEFSKTEVRLTSAVTRGKHESITIRCNASNYGQWARFQLDRVDLWGERKLLLEVSSQNGADQLKGHQLGAKMLVTSDFVVVSVDIARPTCEDTGTYRCFVESSFYSSSDRRHIRVKGHVAPPVASLPVEIVENRPLRESVVCSGLITEEGGHVLWKYKKKGSEEFEPLSPAIARFEERATPLTPCLSNLTSSLTSTPSMDINGTALKCEIVQPNRTSHLPEISTVLTIMVVPANFCVNHPANSTLSHPYDCNKYVRCLVEGFDVLRCPDDLCYNPKIMKCGETGLFMNDANGRLKKDTVSFECRLLHLGAWNWLSIHHVNLTGRSVEVVKVTRDGQKTSTADEKKGRLYTLVEKTKYQVKLGIWLYQVACEDEGRYVCRVSGPFQLAPAVGYLTVIAPPEPPEMTFPSSIIEDKLVRVPFTCEANVGEPGGRLEWKMKRRHESAFTPVPYSVTEEETNGSCSRWVKSSFTLVPSLADNGTLLRCEVRSNYTTLGPGPMVAVRELLVIPGNFCGSENDSIHQHPFLCRSYIRCTPGDLYVQQCTDGMCFNPVNKQCDRPEPSAQDVDPRHPCEPDKNGLFFPHPFICNRYYWCVHGEEVERICKIGTLYWANGLCTFNTQQAHCFMKAASKR